MRFAFRRFVYTMLWRRRELAHAKWVRALSPYANPRLVISLFTLATLLLGVAAFDTPLPVAHAAAAAPLLPGETVWSGVPSDMFGLGDTWNYIGSPAFDESSVIQQQVRNAHVPLIRAFFETKSETDGSLVSDTHQLAIAQAIQNTGAACMANITQPVTVTQALHLVTILKPYCRYFEIYNEPDLDGTSAATYLAFWNAFIPQARSIDPTASFGGPALSCEYGDVASDGCPSLPDGHSYLEQILTPLSKEATNLWPDFISYHFYICAGDSQSNCLNDAASYTPGHGKSLTALLAVDFPGKSVPQGITEWSADPGNPGWAYNDTFMAQFEQTALSGFETNPYLSFLTQFDIASYAGYGSLDLFRTSYPEVTSGSETIDYSNTAAALGSPRPMFGVLAGEIARLSNGSSPTNSPTPTPSPVSSSIPHYAHVITIMEENHSYSDIIGSSSAPYINGMLLKQGALATNYTANVQSSLPNYLILTGGSDLGLTANCEPSSGCESGGPSIASEALSAGKTWKAYEENMTQNCQNVVDGGTGGLYTIHHNPFPYYTGLTSCATNDVPFTQLATDLQSPSTLPNYVFVTPDLNNDMHNGTIAAGDTWLSQEIPAIQNSPACTQSTCLIAITWDEGSYDASGNPLSPHVATIFLGPDVNAGATDAGTYSHFNLLKTEELALGLPTMTTNDANAAPMAGMFVPSSVPTPVPPTPTPTPVPPTPTPIPPTPTPTPSPTPSPTPTGVPCIELVNGVMTVGTCTGTFTPKP